VCILLLAGFKLRSFTDCCFEGAEAAFWAAEGDNMLPAKRLRVLVEPTAPPAEAFREAEVPRAVAVELAKPCNRAVAFCCRTAASCALSWSAIAEVAETFSVGLVETSPSIEGDSDSELEMKLSMGAMAEDGLPLVLLPSGACT
jgi:hypothetical protein